MVKDSLMPEARLQRARRTLPAGYQFGDAASAVAMRALDDRDGSRVVARTLMQGDRVVWQMTPEGEPSPSDAERHPVIEGALPWRAPHQNAAEQLVRRAGWNVIEGEEP